MQKYTSMNIYYQSFQVASSACRCRDVSSRAACRFSVNPQKGALVQPTLRATTISESVSIPFSFCIFWRSSAIWASVRCTRIPRAPLTRRLATADDVAGRSRVLVLLSRCWLFSVAQGAR